MHRGSTYIPSALALIWGQHTLKLQKLLHFSQLVKYMSFSTEFIWPLSDEIDKVTFRFYDFLFFWTKITVGDILQICCMTTSAEVLNLVGFFLFLIHWRYKCIKQMFLFHILDGRLYLKTTVMYWIFPAENTCATVKNVAVRHWLIRSSVETKRFQTNFLNFIYQCSSKM